LRQKKMSTGSNAQKLPATPPLVLCEEKFAACSIPSTFKDVLSEVQTFCELSSRYRDESESNRAALLDVLHECHTRLLNLMPCLLEPPAIQNEELDALCEVVAKAALVLATFRSRLVCDLDIVDTARSETIRFHQSDFRSPTANETDDVSQMCDFLRVRLAIGAEQLVRIRSSLDEKVQIAERRIRLLAAIRDEFQIRPDSESLHDAVGEFFSMLYKGTGIPASEIHVVITSGMAFFALPFFEKENELCTARFRQLSPDEKKPTIEFLNRLHTFTQKQFAHFPAFGFIDTDRLDHDKLARVAIRAGVPVNDLLTDLGSMVTILPLGEIDKYLVHDVWGHGWQAALLGFSSMYRGIASFGNPLDLAEEAARGQQATMAFKECFEGTGDEVGLNEERYLDFVEAEIRERLAIALTPVFAEMMADVIEHKFMEDNPDKARLMPSSSAFKEFPTKLDLTFQDIPFYFLQATKVFRSWAARADRQAKTVKQLVADGAAEPAARAAVSRAVELWKQLESNRYSDQLQFALGSGDEISLNMIGRLLLNFASIHAATLRCYREIGQLTPDGSHLRSFRELMVIAASVFFEQAPSRNLWRIDEFLALRFPAIVGRLANRNLEEVNC
jgi:hypothetical protein